MPEGIEYIVEDGDCVSSIAEQHGFFWQTIWDHSKNQQLKEKRKDPNVLLAGDVILVPQRTEKQFDGATEKRHKFRKKGVPAKFRIRLLRENKPRVGLKFVLEIDGRRIEGTTDGDGWIDVPIAPTARQAKLVVEENNQPEAYVIDLGHLDPVSEPSGASQRLKNLGYDLADGNDRQLERALRTFQTQHNLRLTGELDNETQAALLKAHGS